MFKVKWEGAKKLKDERRGAEWVFLGERRQGKGTRVKAPGVSRVEAGVSPAAPAPPLRERPLVRVEVLRHKQQ